MSSKPSGHLLYSPDILRMMWTRGTSKETSSPKPLKCNILKYMRVNLTKEEKYEYIRNKFSSYNKWSQRYDINANSLTKMFIELYERLEALEDKN